MLIKSLFIAAALLLPSGFLLGQEIQDAQSNAHNIIANRTPEVEAEFFDLLNFASSARESARTLKQSLDDSELVVRGVVDSVIEGRVLINGAFRTIPPIRTSLIKIEVTDVIKGSAGRFLYLEFITGALEPERLNYSKYAGEMLLFLTPSTGLYAASDQIAEDSVTAADAINQGFDFYALTLRSRLFVVEENDSGEVRLSSPLGQGAYLQNLYDSISSLDELEAEIRRLL